METNIWSPKNTCLAPSSPVTSCPGARVRCSRPLRARVGGGEGSRGEETTVKRSQGPTSLIKSRPGRNASVVPGFVCVVDSGACACPALPRPLLLSYGTSARAQGPGPRLSGSREEREGPRGRGRGRKGEIRETSHSGRTRQTGSGQGGAGSGARSGGRALGGRGAAEAWAAADRSRRVGSPRPRARSGVTWMGETPLPRTLNISGSSTQGAELHSWLRPRPDPSRFSRVPIRGLCRGGGDSEMTREKWGARECESAATGVLGAGWLERQQAPARLRPLPPK